MHLLDVIILGIVEGITEFLPISSTGHMILTSKLLGLPPTEFLKSFEIAIQLGAILSVVFLYRKQLTTDMEALKRVAVAFLPTAVIGFVLYKMIKKFLLGNSSVVLWSLLLGGIFIIIFELLHKEKKGAVNSLSTISFKQAFIIGICQSLAVVPGVSRSAATIIGGLMLGVERKTIVEFSFLLAIPTMACATGLDLLKTSASFNATEVGYLAVGFVVSFITALAAIKFLLAFIKNNNFIPFGIYRVLLALALWRLV